MTMLPPFSICMVAVYDLLGSMTMGGGVSRGKDVDVSVSASTSSTAGGSSSSSEEPQARPATVVKATKIRAKLRRWFFSILSYASIENGPYRKVG